MTYTDTDTDSRGVTVLRTWDDGDLTDQRCERCGVQLTDDDRGPFYDTATDDGTPHVCRGVPITYSIGAPRDAFTPH